MPKQKMKTNRSAAKRYRVTGKGHVKVGRKGKGHLMIGKSTKRLRGLRGTKILGPRDEAKALSLIPYA